MTNQRYALHLGDCLDYMRDMEDGSVDAVITDPPYGIDYQSTWPNKPLRRRKILNDKGPFVAWVEGAFRVTRDGGALICFCRWDVEQDFRAAISAAGFAVKSQVIWDKVAHGMGDLTGAFAPRHENIIFATKGNFVFRKYRPATVIRCPRVPAKNLTHPNEKPTSLLSQLIEPILPRGELVFDPFMGSGATGVAAMQLGRRFIGCEIDPNYFEVARMRIERAARQAGLFDEPDQDNPELAQGRLLSSE